MSVIKVVPAPGRRVLNPDNIPPAPLPPEGAMVVKTTYWVNRRLDGDVEFVAADVEKPAAMGTDLAKETADPAPKKAAKGQQGA